MTVMTVGDGGRRTWSFKNLIYQKFASYEIKTDYPGPIMCMFLLDTTVPLQLCWATVSLSW